MKLIKKCVNAMFYGGLEEDDYQKVQDSLIEKNRKMLYLTGSICMLQFIGMFLSTFLPAGSETMGALRLRSRLIYFLMIMVCGITMLIRKQQHRYNAYITIEWYIFLSVLFGFSIWAGTYNQPYNPSITFFVFLFALPLLIIDRPIRLCCYLITVSLIFVFCSFRTKTLELFELDLMNCLCFLYLSISLSIIMMLFKYNEALQKVKIEEQRDRDELTGLLNKAAIEREVCKCLKTKEQGFLLILDIDDFKYINDHYGHLYGDTVLCAYAKCFRETFYESSLLGRFGGDEFIVFLKCRSFSEVGQLFETARKVLDTMVNSSVHDGMFLTMSAGAVFYAGDDQEYRNLLELADQALYEAKHEGKNQIKLKRGTGCTGR